MLHLNHFYNHPHLLNELKLPHLANILDDPNILYEMSFMFYGNDITLNKFYINRLLHQPGKNHVKLYESTITINGVEISYKSNQHFMEFNFKTHLNKEKIAMIQFIKDVTSSKKPSNIKHIMILDNIDYINDQQQYKLRRLIEKASVNATFICNCNVLSKIIGPLRSRFVLVRIPMLSNLEKKYIASTVLDTINSVKEREPLHKYVQRHVETLQDLVCIALSYDTLSDDVNKSFKAFKFVEKEVKYVLGNIPRYKSSTDAITSIRQSVYKIIHYNINHVLVAKMILNTCSTSSVYKKHLHSITNRVAQFDLNLLHINQCKSIHVYESLFLDITMMVRS